ncbi:MAG: hypothetical protein SVV03_02560 [Candidatus Nanohaloarchaea archaeon]|nr:hypothetical protein [Candidatus Nanohaloarchaea archaeon]
MSEEDDIEADVSFEDERKAPLVSVKMERKLNLGDYESATAQVFVASGTLDNHKQLVDEDGEINDEVIDVIEETTKQLGAKARDKVVQALRQQDQIDIQVEE